MAPSTSRRRRSRDLDSVLRRFCTGGYTIKYDVGDEVQVYIAHEDDPDHKHHEEMGEVVDILEDELSGLTGDPEDDFPYTVDFYEEELGEMDFRYDNLQEV